jgi:tetratricopeptide (TPR) repeat protein
VTEVDEGRLVLDPAYTNLLAQFDHLSRSGRDGEAIKVAETLAMWSYLINQIDDWHRVATWRLDAARRLDLDTLEPLVDLGMSEAFSDRHEHAIEHLEESTAAARRRADHRQAARSLLGLGVVRRRQERLREAVALNREALAELEAGGHQGSDVHRLVLNNLGVVHRERGDADAALACYEEAESIAAGLGDTLGVAMALINQCQASLDLRQWADASALGRRAREIAAGRGYVEIEMSGWMNAALADMERGEFAAATRGLSEHWRLAEAWGAPLDLAKNIHNQGWMAHLQGDDERASTLLRKAIDAKLPLGNRVSSAAAHSDLGQVLLRRGDVGGAIEQMERAADLFEEAGSQRAAELRAEMDALRAGPVPPG